MPVPSPRPAPATTSDVKRRGWSGFFAASPAGPLYFYAALFEPGTLSLETLVSNGAAYEFRLE